MDTPNLLAYVLRRYSPKEVAEILEVAPKTVLRWADGDNDPGPLVAEAIKLRLIPPHQPPKKPAKFRFIDLFAGIGGMRIGFERQGGQCVFTSEWDAYAQRTYAKNFPDGPEHMFAGDITKVREQDIPDHDVLVAGFPCQPFSIAGVSKKNALGRPHGFADATQGTLFFDVARIIAHKRPQAFLLENVKNLVNHDKGRTFDTIRTVLESAELGGYRIFTKVIDGRHFVPQHRERIIIVGFRDKGVDFDWGRLNLKPIHEGPKLDSVLHREDGSDPADWNCLTGPKGKVHSRYTLSDKLWEYLQAYADKHREKGNGFGFGQVTKHDTTRTLSARYYKDGSEILVYQGRNKNPRRLTPRECARLMGFDDSFHIPVSDTRAYKQFGN